MFAFFKEDGNVNRNEKSADQDFVKFELSKSLPKWADELEVLVRKY